MTKHIRRALRYEKRKASAHRGTHIGGPGKPDYVRGNVVGEVKNRVTKVSRPELMRLRGKGIGEVESKAGFTQPAIEYRNRYSSGLKLFYRDRRL